MRIILWFEQLLIPPKIVYVEKNGIGVSMDIRIYPSLWVEGKLRQFWHRYMMLRKARGLTFQDPWWKLFLSQRTKR